MTQEKKKRHCLRIEASAMVVDRIIALAPSLPLSSHTPVPVASKAPEIGRMHPIGRAAQGLVHNTSWLFRLGSGSA